MLTILILILSNRSLCIPISKSKPKQPYQIFANASLFFVCVVEVNHMNSLCDASFDFAIAIFQPIPYMKEVEQATMNGIDKSITMMFGSS